MKPESITAVLFMAYIASAAMVIRDAKKLYLQSLPETYKRSKIFRSHFISNPLRNWANENSFSNFPVRSNSKVQSDENKENLTLLKSFLRRKKRIIDTCIKLCKKHAIRSCPMSTPRGFMLLYAMCKEKISCRKRLLKISEYCEN